MTCTVPNWSQALIARAAGLDPDKVMVRSENDRNISFLQLMPRADIIVSKVTGEKVARQDPYAASRHIVEKPDAEQLRLAKV